MMLNAHPVTTSVAGAPAPAADAAPGRGSPPAIRSWADRQDRAWIEALQASFLQSGGRAEFHNTFYGPDAVLAGVYTGTADLAWMAREIRDRQEIMAYQWTMLEPPYPVEFAHGAMDADSPGTQLCVIVHPSNPVSQLSLAELDAIFGWECRRGGERITHWSEAVSSRTAQSWAILPVSAPVDCVEMLHIRDICLLNSFKWNPKIRQVFSGWSDIVAVVGNNPAAIAIVPMNFADDSVKIVSLAGDGADEPVMPCRAAIRSETYPLTRTRKVFANRTVLAASQALREFLSFVLSDQGQSILEETGGLIGLSAGACQAALRKVSP